jgi:small subunit ribosomal protein S6e
LATFKLTISDKKGKSTTRELKEKDANPLLGLQIGNELDAAIIGQSGKIRITGGSDKSGVPMREDIHGGVRKYVMLSKGVGLRDAEKGQRFRKTIRGNTITEDVYQINCSLDGELKIDVASSPTEEKKETADKSKKA